VQEIVDADPLSPGRRFFFVCVVDCAGSPFVFSTGVTRSVCSASVRSTVTGALNADSLVGEQALEPVGPVHPYAFDPQGV